MRKCDHGCGKEALFYCKRFKSWRCNRYAASCPAIVAKRQKKKKETMLKRYGAENTLQSSVLSKKMRKTMKERHGFETTFSSSKMRNKRDKTMVEKYGVKTAAQCPELLQKIMQTNFHRYGVKCVFSSKIIKDKVQKTLIKKYGVSNPMDCLELRNKMVATRRKNGSYFSTDFETELDEYYFNVLEETKKSWNNYYDIINPSRLPRGKYEYHLDHIYPVHLGYKEGIEAKIIGSMCNLQMLYWKDNIIKGGRNKISKKELLRRYSECLEETTELL